VSIRFKKDAAGNIVSEDKVTSVLTQAQVDAEAQYAAALRVDPYAARKIKENAASGAPLSAGALVAMSKIGIDANSKIGNNIATIDAQTREARTANQQDLALKRSNEEFEKTARAKIWKVAKGATYVATVAGEAIWNGLNAAYRTSTQALDQSIKSFSVGGYTVPRGQDIQIAQKEIQGVGQQTVLGQIVKKSVSDISEGKLPDLELGQGFFPNESLGEAYKARQLSLTASKIAVRDSKGKIIGYQPRNILGDAYSSIFTLGNPESAAGRNVAMVSELIGSFSTDTFLAFASEAKALKKAAAQARAKGAMDEAAVYTERLDKLTAAQNLAEETRAAALRNLDAIPSSEAARAKEAADSAKAVYTDKTNAAAKNSNLVRPALVREQETIAWTKARQAELDAAKKALAEANSALKAPKEISKVEADVVAKTKELKDLRKSVKDAGGSYRLETQPGYFQIMDKDSIAIVKGQLDELKVKLNDLKTVANPVNPVSTDRIQELTETISRLNLSVKEGNKAITAARKQVEERIKSAKRAARAEEIAMRDYSKTRSKDRKLSEIIADKTLSAQDKVNAWQEQLKILSGLKAADGTTSFSYEKMADFLTGGFGTAGLERLAKITEWQKIWRASGKKIDAETAKALAAAETTEDVVSIIAPFILRSGKGNAGILKPGIIERAGDNFAERTSELANNLSFMLPAARVLTGAAARIQHRMMHHVKVAQLFDGFQSGLKGQVELFGKPLKTAYQTKVRAGTLINIKDTDAMLEMVDDFGKAIKMDETVLNKLLDEIATGATSATRGYTASVKLLEAAFNQFADKIPSKMQDDWRKTTTAFKESNEQMSSYWASRHTSGAELEYITLNGKKIKLKGPHLESELLNGTVYIPSPAEFIKFTSKLARLPGGKTGIKVADTLISNWWKKSVLVRPAFVIRNIGEEQLRVFGTGHISFFNNPLMAMAMWMGRAEGPEWRKFLYAFDNYKHTIFNKDFSTGDDVADILNETMGHNIKNSYVDIITSDRGGSFDDKSIKVLALSGIGPVTIGHPRFFDGVANQLRVLNADEMTRVVAGKTPKEVAAAIAAGVKREDAVVDYFFSGPGRKDLEDLYSAYGEEVQSWLKTREGLKEYLYTGKLSNGKDGSVLARVIETTGGNSSLRQIVAFGKTNLEGVVYKIPRADVEAINSISNAKEIAKGRKALLTAQEQFAKQIEKTFKPAGNWDDMLVNVPSKNRAFAEGKLDKLNIVDKFFDVATRLEKNSTFGPEFRQAYWDAINEIALALDAKAVAKLEEVAQSSLSPLVKITGKTSDKHPVWSAFKAAKGDGPLSIEDAHAYADNYARNHVKELFYNASERRLIFHQLRLIGPFMNAWEDTIRRWTEIGLENPAQVYKGIKSLAWLQSPEASSLYQLTDARDYYNPEEGFFFNDPNSGQEMFWVPFVGTVMSKLAGGLTGNNYKGAPIAFATNPMSFNFALGGGSILPGMGPGVTLPINALATWNQSFSDNLPDGIKNWLFPFGRSDFSSGPLAAILPANWNRIIGGGLGIKDTYSQTFKPVMAYLANGNNYNLDNPEDQAKLIRDTDLFSRWFGIMRGVVGLVAPSALQVRGITSDGNGDAVTQIALYKDFQDMLVNNDNNYNQTVAEFLDLYGVSAVFAIISSSVGNAPTNWDSYKFVTENPDVVDKYGDIWGYVYPGGGLSQEMYKWNLLNNTKKKLTPKEMLEKANNTRYYAALDSILTKVDAGYMDKDQYKQAKNFLKTSMGGGPKSSTDFNKFSRVIYQLETLTKDKRFAEIPSVSGLRDYLYLRNIALSNLNKGPTDKMLGKGEEVMAQRAWLSEQAVWIIKDNPDFQKIFYQFFADELEGK